VGNDADGRPIHRTKGKRSPATISRYHSALSAVLTWGIRKRRVPKSFENPCRKVARPPGGRSIVRFLSDAERTRLLAACRASKWARLYPFVLLALTTGARRGKLASLRWRDIDLERAQAYIADTKNSEPRVLPLLSAVVEELGRLFTEDQQRFKVVSAQQLVFRSRTRPDVPYHSEAVWQAALKAARVRNFWFHDLRHTCASYLAQSGASLLEIADVLGHRQLQMTQRYSHLTTKSKSALLQPVLGEIK
jgi:integrase